MTSELTVYMKPGCPFCARLLGDLAALGVEHATIDVEQSTSASALVEEVNGGNRIVPTVAFPDGSYLTNPPAADVVTRLAEQTAYTCRT